MKLLVGEAARRGLTLKTLAKLADRDARALSKTIRAKRPQAHPIKSVATALGFPSAVGKALTNELTIADGRKVLQDTIADEAVQRFGSGAYAAALASVGLTHEAGGLSGDALLEAGRVAALARAFGLDGSDDVVLGPVLGAIEHVLQPHGRSLRTVVGDEAMLRLRTLEGSAAFAWLEEVFGVTAAQADELRRIVPRLRDAADVTLTDAEFERHRQAVRAARRAFIDTFTFQRGAGESTFEKAVFGTLGSHERSEEP
ncbi:MAG: hypothetical protein WB810_14895 [Candidatus Cybelea sp.]